MSTELTKMFEGHEVRMAGTPSNPLFIAKDVCDVLGLKNPSVVVAALDEDERAKLNLGRQGETNCVTESGLYHLVFKSRKAAAKRFRRWVTEEVLPELRKSGSYGVNTPTIQELNEQMLNMLDMWIDRGVPAEKASACVSNTYKEAVSKALSLPLSLPSH